MTKIQQIEKMLETEKRIQEREGVTLDVDKVTAAIRGKCMEDVLRVLR